MAHPNIDLDSLSIDEQLEVLDRLCERLGRDPGMFPPTDEQKRILDERDAELDRDLAAGRSAGIPWEQVRADAADEVRDGEQPARSPQLVRGVRLT